jgi:16S rRNA (guanine527-N7)-methyltransferase
MTAKTGTLRPRIERAAATLGVALEDGTRERLETWLERLKEWNARIDLTAARSDDELVDLMVADALVLAPHIPADARLIDVGSGAGAPGLALALLRPDLGVTLVEPVGKRSAFLRTVVGEV